MSSSITFSASTMPISTGPASTAGPEGFAKVVASPSGKILGATILGEEASLVLQQLVLAMDAGLGLGDLAETTQIYPTYGQVIRELADQFRTTRLERGFVARALSVLLRLPAPLRCRRRSVFPHARRS